MASPLRQYQDDFLEHQHVEQTPKFKPFEQLTWQEDVQFQELLYFIRLSSFCVLTVLLSFVFLSLQFPALVALPLAGGLSFGAVYGIMSLIKKTK